MLTIKEAKYLEDYEIELKFSDGRSGVVDLSEFIHEDPRSVFAPLKNKNVFKNFRLEYTLHWGEEIDLAPEFLYFKAFEQQKELQAQFKEWGYVA